MRHKSIEKSAFIGNHSNTKIAIFTQEKKNKGLIKFLISSKQNSKVTLFLFSQYNNIGQKLLIIVFTKKFFMKKKKYHGLQIYYYCSRVVFMNFLLRKNYTIATAQCDSA